MEASVKQIIFTLAAVIILHLHCLPLSAQDNTEDFFTISGVVKDARNRNELGYVNISVPGTPIGTVTNGEGVFTLKISRSLNARIVEVTHLGYFSENINLTGQDMSGLDIRMTPAVNTLEEVIVRGGDARSIVEAAISRVRYNYSKNNSLLTGFYRETAQKGRNYINIAEAVINIYKTSYDNNVIRDRVQVFKGRSLLSQKRSDTLAVKLLGGPNLSVYVDIVKNPDLLLSAETLPLYSFKLEESEMINDRLQFVVSFRPQMLVDYALYEGKLYIDREKLSFTRAEFNLDMSDRDKATTAILKKKPYGLHFRPLEVSFLVTYKERDSVTYLSYIRNEVRFRCDWKRKLFGTNYTITSEMVVTDGQNQDVEYIPYRESFKSTQSLSDRVSDFSDPDFWGAYNIIAPTESLESAVNRLRRQRR